MVALFLADGFEEIEAITVVDILRRADIPVQTVSIGRKTVVGGHKIAVEADLCWADFDADAADVLVLPGGLSGVENLLSFSPLEDLLKQKAQQGALLAAICAAPIIFGAFGLLKDRRATCYPDLRDRLTGAIVCKEAIVWDDNFLTSRGPGTAMVFGLELVRRIKGEPAAKTIADGMLYHG